MFIVKVGLSDLIPPAKVMVIIVFGVIGTIWNILPFLFDLKTQHLLVNNVKGWYLVILHFLKANVIFKTSQLGFKQVLFMRHSWNQMLLEEKKGIAHHSFRTNGKYMYT